VVIIVTAIFAATLVAAVRNKHAADRREMERYSITPEALQSLLASNQDVLLVDVRQPLDLLGDTVIIPGAKWIAPREVLQNPSIISREKEVIVYCTCPSTKTSRTILHRALEMGFFRIKFLNGGLKGWRAGGFPVEPYDKPFYLDSATAS
jgi:rhodanese-related sulfurtransferase